jgi:hypothetical protein
MSPRGLVVVVLIAAAFSLYGVRITALIDGGDELLVSLAVNRPEQPWR